MVRIAGIVLLLCVTANSVGCAPFGGWLAGYTCERGPCVIDPRGAVAEPCCNCEPVDPTCCDSNACDQLRWGRETFFDSLYALICECNLWPNSDCCQDCRR